MRLIKKYKNRRLYDTERSQYITIEELQKYVLDGVEFRVEDSTTREDLTNTTLLQIFVEMEEGATKFLSVDMLRQLICLAHHPLSQSFKAVIAQMFGTIEQQAQDSPFTKDYKKASEAWGKQMEQITSQWQDLFKR